MSRSTADRNPFELIAEEFAARLRRRAGYLRQVRTQLVVTPMMLLMWVRGVRFMYSVDRARAARRQAALAVTTSLRRDGV